MKIALAARNLRGKTGVSAIVLEQIRRFRARADSVDVLGEKLDAGLIAAAGGTAVKFKRLPGSRYRSRRWFASRAAGRIRRTGYDLVIGNGEILNQDVLFIHNLTHLERDLVPVKPGAGLRSKIRFDEDIFRRDGFRICVANSELTRNELINRHDVDPAKLRVAYPGHDPAVFDSTRREAVRLPERAALGATDTILIGFITSGHYAKRGADIFAATLGALPAELQKRIRVLAIGSPANTAEMRNLLEAQGLETALICREKTTQIEDYYFAIDLLFYPARMEEFGLVVLEAAACGTPVLTSTMTGAAEVLASPEIALAEQPDVSAFLPRLRTLLESPQTLRATAELQLQAAKQLTWEHYFRELFSLYETLD